MTPAGAAFALVGAVHAGFSLTVTLLVYPALADAPAARWRETHDRHSRRIVALVAVLYVGLLAAGGWLVVAGPGPAGWVALAGAGGALAVTAGLAAPLHGRLTRHDPALVRRLLRVDRMRTAAALVGAVAGVWLVR